MAAVAMSEKETHVAALNLLRLLTSRSHRQEIARASETRLTPQTQTHGQSVTSSGHTLTEVLRASFSSSPAATSLMRFTPRALHTLNSIATASWRPLHRKCRTFHMQAGVLEDLRARGLVADITRCVNYSHNSPRCI